MNSSDRYSQVHEQRRRILCLSAAALGNTFIAACGGGDAVFPSQNTTPEALSQKPPLAPPLGVSAPLPPTPPAEAGLGPLAAFIPAPGGTANVNLNDLSEFNPCPTNRCWYSQSSKQQAAWRNWNGAAWAPGFSANGALVFWGGGHGGGEDVSLYVFDFSTGLWSRVGPNNPTADYSSLAEANAEWYDYLHEGSYIVPALHTYNYPTYVPPGLPGSGKRGQ